MGAKANLCPTCTRPLAGGLSFVVARAAAELVQAERIARLTLGEEKVAIAENLTDVEKAERVPRQAGAPSIALAGGSRVASSLPPPSIDRIDPHTYTCHACHSRVGVLHTSTHDSGA